MSDGFQARRGGGVVAALPAHEADLLRNLAAQVIELLRHEAATPTGDEESLEAMLDFTGPTTAPDDPVLARLFPDAYRDDEEAAADFRRFTESDLRAGKAAQAAAVIDDLEAAGLGDEPQPDSMVDVELDAARALEWLKAFTDIRLALGTRLGVEDEESLDRVADDDPRAVVVEIYHWMSYLQETLVHALSARANRR
jgi:methionine synthase II (cobalamin-independent)